MSCGWAGVFASTGLLKKSAEVWSLKGPDQQHKAEPSALAVKGMPMATTQEFQRREHVW